jgi:hypothetical protein
MIVVMLAVTASPLLYTLYTARAEKTEERVPCFTGRGQCMQCHGEEQVERLFKEERGVNRPCDNACGQCHKKNKAHHQTGMTVDYTVPEDIRLGKDKQVACMTCHDLSVARFSRTARKAQSLFQRMFKGKKKHKTYYLVMDNRSGQLCKKCH